MTKRPTTPSAAAARESARRADGRFGHVPRDEAEIDLAPRVLMGNRPVNTARELPHLLDVSAAPWPRGKDALRYSGRQHAWRQTAAYRAAADHMVAETMAEHGWSAQRTGDDVYEITLPDGTTTTRTLICTDMPGPNGSDGQLLRLISQDEQRRMRLMVNGPQVNTAQQMPHSVELGFAPRPRGADRLRYLGRPGAWRTSRSHREAADEIVAAQAAQRGWTAERTDDDTFKITLPDGTSATRRLINADMPGPYGSDGRQLKLVAPGEDPAQWRPYDLPPVSTAREMPRSVDLDYAPRPRGADRLRYLGRPGAWRASDAHRAAADELVATKMATRGWYAERTEGETFEITLPDGTRTTRRLVNADKPGPYGSDGRELRFVPVDSQ